MKLSLHRSVLHCALPALGALVFASAGCGKEPSAVSETAAVAPAAPGEAARPISPEDVAAAPEAPPEVARDCDDPAVTTALKSLRPDFAKRTATGELRLCGNLEGDARGCIVYTPNESPSDGADGGRFTRGFKHLDEDDFDHVPNFPATFDDGFRREDGRPMTKICISPTDGCKDLFVGRATGGHFDADKTRAVLTTMGDDETRVIRVYDLPSMEEAFAIPLPGTSFIDCTFADFLGGALLIGTGPCTTTDGGSAWLVQPSGGEERVDLKKDAPFSVRDGHYAHVGGDLWAIRSAAGDEVLIVNAKTGETTATIATGAVATKFQRDSAFVLTDGEGRVFILETSPVNGALVEIDAKEATLVTRESPKACAE